MAACRFTLATVLLIGLTGFAQAQARSTWQEPGAPRAGDAPAPRQEAQATPPRAEGPARREAAEEPQARAERPQARPERPAPRAERRPREVRSARYRGGAGSTWKMGRDTHGFAGSYGGCKFRGYAGPNGYRLDRNC